MHGSIATAHHVSWWRRFLAFAGPGYLVSVGYMDPGNWATDLAGGAKFGYALIWVILLSNLMAIFLQTLCARVGVVTGRDLAQACREQYSKPVSIVLWVLCEIAIIACDLAEVIGSAVALNLLFGLPLVWGVVITGFDVMLLLAAMHFGFRKIEAIVLTLVTTGGLCFALQIFLARPDWGEAARGTLVPSAPLDLAGVWMMVGIVGTTIAPSLPRPGLAIACPEVLPDGLPGVLRDWEVIDVSYEEARRLACNGLILDEKTYVMDRTHERVAEQLARRNINVITTAFDLPARFGGGLRCAHHPLVRV